MPTRAHPRPALVQGGARRGRAVAGGGGGGGVRVERRDPLIPRRVHVVDPPAVIDRRVDHLVLGPAELPATGASVRELADDIHDGPPQPSERNGSGTYAARIGRHVGGSSAPTTGSSWTSQARWRRPCSTTALVAIPRGAAGAADRASSARPMGTLAMPAASSARITTTNLRITASRSRRHDVEWT